MEEIVLKVPTVKDLVDTLLLLPQDKKIIIVDADTDWTIDIIHIGLRLSDGVIEMGGEYHEMRRNI